MGKIPEYRNQGIVSQVQTGRIDQEATTGQMIARGAESMGNYFRQQQQAQDASFVSSRAIDLESRARERFGQWQKENESSPLNKQQTLMDFIQQDLDEIGQSAPSGDARTGLQRMGDDLKRRYGAQGAEWADRQLVKNIGDDIDRSSQTLQLEAFRASSEYELDDIFKKHDTLLVTAQTSLGSQAVENINRVGKQEIVSNLVQGLIDRDRLGDAKRLLDSKKYDETLGADKTRQAYQLIDRKREQMGNRQEKLLALKDKDPWKFLAETGETKGITNVAWSGDATAITKSFDQREEWVSSMSQKHGVDIPFLSPQEVDHFTDAFVKMNPRDASALMYNLDNKTTDKQKAMVGRQVFKKEPGLAAALMIAGDDADSARKIVGGLALMRNGDGGRAINTPKQADIDTDFDSFVGSAIEDPGMRTAIKQAASAHMVRSAFETGKRDLETYTKGDFQKSLEAVMGPVADVNGVKTTSFRDKSGRFLHEDDLSDLVDTLKDSDVERIQGDVPRTLSGEPINLKKSRGRITLRAVAEGTYWISTEEGIALDKNKNPFRLNLKAIAAAKTGRQRVGGLTRERADEEMVDLILKGQAK